MVLMRRQSLVKFAAPLSETGVEMPKPLATQVLVRIERCGPCHSDLHIQNGYADLGGGKKLDSDKSLAFAVSAVARGAKIELRAGRVAGRVVLSN